MPIRNGHSPNIGSMSYKVLPKVETKLAQAQYWPNLGPMRKLYRTDICRVGQYWPKISMLSGNNPGISYSQLVAELIVLAG